MVSLLTFSLISYAVASPALLARETIGVYGQGKNEPINAPGVASQPAFKGFPSAGRGPPQTGWPQAFLYSLAHPGKVPPGLNPTKCTPKKGGLPVVLIPGTTASVYDNWAFLGPKLAKEGLCLYSFNHNPLTLPGGEAVGGTAFLGNITESAYALSAFIDQVLELTGYDQVDLVGHSQGGGALPFYYLKNIMEGNKVRKMVGIAPSLGTKTLGLNLLLTHVIPSLTGDGVEQVTDKIFDADAIIQQMSDSDWMRELYQGGLTVENVEYFNIATRFDEVLVPYTNCLFQEPNRNITNILLQDKCMLDFSEHIGLAYSENMFQIIRNCLFGRTHDKIKCKFTPILHF